MIYLDNNATTQLLPEVLDAMRPYLEGAPCNPSSVHAFGRDARNALTRARRSIASDLGVRPSEVLFTSGATESINMVLRGSKPRHIITSTIEHIATLDTLKAIGCEVTYLEPGTYGAITPEQVKEAIRPQTDLITLMAANNETGVMTDIEAIGQLGIPFFVDGVASLGKEFVEIPEGVSAICFSGHKIHGPKGIGVLVLKHHFKVAPLITGGHQESHRRAGTENLPAIVGMAEAVRLAQNAPYDQIRALRDRLEKALQVEVNGEGPRVSNVANLSFPGTDGEGLLMNLDLEGIAVSHGSACSSGSLEPSHVLLGMGYSRERAASSIRFSLSRLTTEEEIDQVIDLCRQRSALGL